jgi:hypothetical protein
VYFDACNIEKFISNDCMVCLAWWCPLSKGIIGEHKEIFHGTIERDTESLFQLSIAPDMVEMAVGIENGNGMGYMAQDPCGSIYARVDNELFPVHCYDITVGLVEAHRLNLDLHAIIPYGFL